MMAEEYQREVAAFNAALPDPNVANSTADILLDKLAPRLPASGTISILAAADIPEAVPSSASATTNGVIVQDGTDGTPNIVYVGSSATANTFGNWVELDAATDADSWLCIVTNIYPATSNYNVLLEIGTGAAGNEVTKVRLSYRYGRDSEVGLFPPVIFNLPIPIKIASGTRIAARAATSAASAMDMAVSICRYQSLET